MTHSVTNKISLFLAICSLSIVLTGCFSEGESEVLTPLPEVNNANCKPVIIASIEPKSSREKFRGLCAKRSGFKKSPEKNWTAW